MSVPAPTDKGAMAKDFDYRKVMNVLGSREQFAQGDVACAYGAILGGCDFFAGYPITPATEVGESMARLMPRLGLTAVQMEDEIASISAIIGASWTGARSMTATSGPGFSLMMEGIGYACMSILHLLDPEVIVLGGGVMEACGDFLMPIVQEVVARDPMYEARERGQIVVSELGDDAGILGAAALARDLADN